MIEFVRLNGAAVRTTSAIERPLAQPNGASAPGIELVVIVRGTMAHREMLELIVREPIKVEIPRDSGWSVFEATIASASYASSGTGEGAVHRHDILLQETPESIAARLAAAPAEPVVAPSAPAEPEPTEDELEAAADLSKANFAGNAAVWSAAFRQFPGAPPAAKPDAPLTTSQLAGIEAVLVNLRLEAVIDQFVTRGLLDRKTLDSTHRRLIAERFVTDAVPVIGETAAKTALKELI